MRRLFLVMLLVLGACQAKEEEVPFRPPPVPLSQLDDRQLAEYFAQQGIQADQRVRTFTPVWDGFSVDPTGDFSYLDFGHTVVLWNDDAMTGTSDATSMTITNVPEAIQPSGSRAVLCQVIGSGGIIFLGLAAVQPNGDISFSKGLVAGTEIAFGTFSAAGTKGLASGFLIQYAK